MTFSNIPNGESARGYSQYLTRSDKTRSNITNKKYDYNEADPMIVALDINWCGAQLGNSSNNSGKETINTTEELLTLIDTMNTRLYNLTAAVIALSNK